MADTPTGETVVVEEPKNNATPTVTPPVEKPVDPELEKARKEAENATLRANQLQNQLKAKEDADAAAEAKRLEENNEFKTLYEQSEEKRKALETAQAQAEKTASIKTEADKIFAEYSPEVKALADEVGLTLADTDDTTTEDFKSKLDKISESIKAPKVTANNPGTPGSGASDPIGAMELQGIMRDPVKFQEYLDKNFKGISGMKRRTE